MQVALETPQLSIKTLHSQLKQCHQLLNEYSLEDCLSLLRHTLLSAPLLTSDPNNEYPAVVSESKEYILAILLEIRKRSKDIELEETIKLNLF